MLKGIGEGTRSETHKSSKLRTDGSGSKADQYPIWVGVIRSGRKVSGYVYIGLLSVSFSGSSLRNLMYRRILDDVYRL